ncbi:hypothetical protein J14TS2_37680 [Bacillus sp. J14TS2]|uniref:DUF1295 domain-containing protein n=1 Tax=Bacillus sp. J14TS2 TaxID=2807188 RepID=UPI001B1796C8|nr:DUF1295 domain-containing protein [Bacillus sp. J14TS2]GIN73293.1 hypothetical protein J14TS2_37680 [Bacillus sp. J14TS2]
MYGSANKSWPQRLTILASECVLLVFVYWFLFLNGNEIFHLPEGDFYRKELLFVFCLIVFFRMSFMVVYLLKRGITWGEAGSVPFAFAFYYIGFSVLGGITDKPLDWIDGIAVFLFLAGSVINTLAEILRDRWKRHSRNKGKLYTGGLFKYAIHINYFGDVVWVTGFALLTRNMWSGVMPLFLFLMFVFLNIPHHDQYLRGKYGKSFEQYEKETKRFIPFVY